MAVEDSAAIALLPELLMIELTIHHPSELFWYVSITVAGAITGSLIPFSIARALGHEWVRKKMPERQFARIHRWFERNEMMAVAVPSVLPPPVPFKLFVLVAGLFEMRWLKFVAAMGGGRYARYLLEAWLGLRFGPEILRYGLRHPWLAGAVAVGLLAAAFLYGRLQGDPGVTGSGPGALAGRSHPPPAGASRPR